ncbi:LysR family transcriptional regulator [Mycobacterium sp.]|jgi:DNA-binding transcriptional LysR family regulator|uniref:LysR family transcriptional regulator n=1 Tax=Mycobacterium sp. TaxID=1785 RepID=UPI002D6DBCC4|nr:LysR family transcriptional regulator [Mycobacterium sp.]HZA08934.1 LysR family transcriptional regulator [Mycobacterium sp.]
MSYDYFTPARLHAFVAVADEGGLSAAARRLHVSQPTLSHTIHTLEHQLGVQLFVRTRTGVRLTPAGRALLEEAQAILGRHDQLLRAMAEYAHGAHGVLRLGIPLQLAPDLMRAVAEFATTDSETRVEPRHLPMAEQLAALRGGQLDLSFMRERPDGAEFDTMLVACENLGVLLARDLAARLAGPDGIRLDDLTGMDWVDFPRSTSPAWHDELAAILRTHGINSSASPGRGDDFAVLSVLFTAVSSGHAFALAPSLCANPVRDTVVWTPLLGRPVVRRTWAVWPANSRRRDVAQLITALERVDTC